MFEKFVETINNTGKAVGEKTRQGSDIVKANIKIASEERTLTDIYTEMGKLYYEKHKDDPCCETMTELCAKAGEKLESIEELKKQVRTLKGVNICANCGAEVALDNDFCGKCGAKVEKPAPAAEPAKECSEATGDVIDHEDNVEASDIKIEVDPEDKGE